MEIKIHNPNNLPLIDYRTVKPLQGNLKDLTESNYNKLKNVLVKRGFKVPLYIWRKLSSTTELETVESMNGDLVADKVDYYLLDGHQRQRVMIKENMQPYEVPYILIEAKDAKEAKAQLLEFSSQYGTITQEGFDEFTDELDNADFEDVIFDALAFVNRNEPETIEDEAPPVADVAISQLGEIYQLGRHRLMCGDSTDFGQVSDLMDGAEADMVFTDPPYGVDYTGKTKDALKLENDKTTEIFARAIENFITKLGAVYYVCCPAGNNFMDFANAFATRCKISSTIIWAKNSMVLGHGDYHYQHEPILYGWDKSGTHKFYGRRDQTTLWSIDRPTQSLEHPTMKPIELCSKAISNSSLKDQLVLDLFGGSGSTLIACEQLGRTCYMMELDPKYCDVIRKRYWKFVNNGDGTGWQENTPAINKEPANA